jgi:predicted transcriptional regulator
MEFAEALNDPIRAAQLEELHEEVQSQIKAMELNKNVLEDEVSSGLEEIRRQREELDRREKEIIENMVREDKENKVLIGRLLEESARNILEESGRCIDVEGNQGYLDAGTDDDEVDVSVEPVNGTIEHSNEVKDKATIGDHS